MAYICILHYIYTPIQKRYHQSLEEVKEDALIYALVMVHVTSYHDVHVMKDGKQLIVLKVSALRAWIE